MKLLFVTSNPNKVLEIASLLPAGFTLQSLQDIGFSEEIPETADTIEGNSFLKTSTIAQKFDLHCFAEDTGLLIDALDGEPGVRTARYAGEQACNQDNISLVLNNMKGAITRKAHFKTVLTYFDGQNYHSFEGICKGTIREEPKGEEGFGYDPIFMPEGSNLTFAEMNLDEKNKFSHRKKAFEKFILHLTN